MADAAELRHQLDDMGAVNGGFAEERAAVERAEYDLAAAQRAFAASAAPDGNADDLRLARRDLETRRDALARIDTQLDRVAARLEGASSRVEELTAEQQELEASYGRVTAGLPARRQATVAARDAVAAATDAQTAAETAARDAEAEAARWQARAEALAAALDQARNRDAAAALGDVPGVVGPLVDLLEIDAGAERAVTAVLGDALSAIVVDGPGARRVWRWPAWPTATPVRSCWWPGPDRGTRCRRPLRCRAPGGSPTASAARCRGWPQRWQRCSTAHCSPRVTGRARWSSCSATRRSSW